MTTGIYGIWDSLTRECLYIGQSSNIESRWKKHLYRLRAGKALKEFQDWFDSVARDESRLRFAVLQRCDNIPELKDRLEIQWFRGFNPKFYGRVPEFNQGGGITERVKLQISTSLLNVFDGIDMTGRTFHERKLTNLPKAEHQPRVSARVEPRHKLQCVGCGSAFRHTKHTAKYCSKLCSTEHRLGKNFDYKVAELYNAGYSLRQVGTKLGISYVTVRNHLVSQGIELRSSHPSNRI